MDGFASPGSPRPFADFLADLSTIVPPFTLLGALRRGPVALAINLLVGLALASFAWMMIRLTGNLPQWSAAALGYYAVFSWACVLKQNDRATFRLIWGKPAFIKIGRASCRVGVWQYV